MTLRTLSAIAFTLLAGSLAVPAEAQPQGSAELSIQRNGSIPSSRGPAAWFTGTVRLDAAFTRDAPARLGGATVTFEPGARTNWHTHPLGQTLVVTAGQGWVQREGGPVEVIRPGDIVLIPAGVKHWHGASATTAMTHLALQESLDGQAVTWLEPVTQAQYPRRASVEREARP